MKICVTGYNGRLGIALVDKGCIPINCDITMIAGLCDAVYTANPEVIVHCAALTDVDWCEENPDEAFKVNVRGVHNLLTCVGEMYPRPKIIFPSTDYIFDGRRGPYDEKAKPNPMGKYGMMKLGGETVLNNDDIIVRTTILYGSKATPDFVTKVLAQFDKNEPFGLPYDAIGNPTYVYHLAEAVLKLCEIENPPHIINIAGLDWVSRYEFGYMIADVFNKDKDLLYEEESECEYRPKKAGLKLGLAKKLGLPLYSLWDGLQAMKDAMK